MRRQHVRATLTDALRGGVAVGISLVFAGLLANQALGDGGHAKYDQIRREHWSFQPLRDVPAPGIKIESQVGHSVDTFVLVPLEKRGLAFAPPADRSTLLRRATFDLTGLPPTPDEIAAFVNDRSPDAFEKVVDRLLASPGFGERWGRHWLDVARYAESTGMTRNMPLYYVWRYRDYVIDSFNADKPYDRFIREQIAGDLLPADSGTTRDEQLVATGFLALGPKDILEKDALQFQLNNVDEQIDATSRTFLGLSVACARCHDHKFDPIPTADYYALAGIFRSTDLLAGVGPWRQLEGFYKQDKLVPLSGLIAENSTARPGLPVSTGITVNFASLLATNSPAEKNDREADKRKRERVRQERRALDDAVAEPKIRPVTLGVRDASAAVDSTIFVRGEPDAPGPVVPRGTVALPGMPSLGTIPPGRSGRLELAGWITDPRNPLTARVMVNRIWQHLFGQGLVRSVDNFGTTGEAPSHPELLDHLAQQFITDGWSIKRTIRRIMLTRAYQQAGTFSEVSFTADPDNVLLWRQSPRRLESEAIRDAMLLASNTIDRHRPSGSDAMKLSPGRVAESDKDGYPFAGAEPTVRSVYLPRLRGIDPPSLEAFDLADSSQVTGSRDVTTVAPQALFMLNNAFVQTQSKAFASRLLSECPDDAARVERAFLTSLGRAPSESERDRTLAYLRRCLESAKSSGKSQDEVNLSAWAKVCQGLFGSAEFRYLN